MREKRNFIFKIAIYIIGFNILLNQTLITEGLDILIPNALIRNLMITMMYLFLLDVYCLIELKKNKIIFKKYAKLSLIISAISCIFLPYDVVYQTNYAGYSIIFNLLILVIWIVSFFIIVPNFLYFIENCCITKNKSSVLIKYIYYLVPIISISFRWIQNFPGLMSFDTHYQLEQITQNKYNDVHPAAHTLFTKLLLQIYDSPATIVFFQILFLTLGIGYIFNYFSKKGVEDKLLIIILIIWSSLTPLQITTIYLWKDVFYSIALLYITIYLIQLTYDRKLTSNISILWLGISLSSAYLFRHNGIVAVIFSIIAIIYIAFKYKYVKVIYSIVLTLVMVGLIKGIVYPLYNVEPNSNGTKYAIIAKSIVSVVANNGDYTEEELTKIEEIMPYDVIKRNYNWSQGNNLLWNIQQKDAAYGFGNTLVGKEKLLIELFISLAPKNMFIMLKDIIGSSAIMWQFDFIRINIFYNHAIYFWTLIIIGITIIIKRGMMFIIPFTPMIGNALSIIISNISYEARYGYPTILLASTLLIYSLYSINQQNYNEIEENSQ